MWEEVEEHKRIHQDDEKVSRSGREAAASQLVHGRAGLQQAEVERGVAQGVAQLKNC